MSGFFRNPFRKNKPDKSVLLEAAYSWGCAPECLLWNRKWKQWAPDMVNTIWFGDFDPPFSAVGNWGSNARITCSI